TPRTWQTEPAQLLSQAPPAAQLSAYRLVEPSGVGPWPRGGPPPPMFRPPQVRFVMRTLLAFRMLPQVPPGTPVVNSRNAPPTDAVVVVVVEVVVLVVVVLVVVDVVVLVVVDVVVLVVVDVVVLVVVVLVVVLVVV